MARNKLQDNLRASKKTIKKYSSGSLEKEIENSKNNISKGLNSRTKNFFKKIEKIKGDQETANPHIEEDASPLTNDKGILDNDLHRFASYATLFTLSGLNEDELQDGSFLQNPVHDVIARSAGIGDPNTNRDTVFTKEDIGRAGPQIDIKDKENKNYQESIKILKKGRDIFFEDVNLLSTCAPSQERGMADFVKMTFKLHEPYGISFIEKFRASARLNGYRDYQDAPMLLTIEFKGYDEKGNVVDTDDALTRKIPILVTRVDLDVNEGGAIYDVTAVRIQDLAFDDRFKFPRTAFDFTASSLRDAMNKIAEKLNEQIGKEKNEHNVREVEDEYIIEVDDEVVSIAKDYSAIAKSLHNFEKPKGPARGRSTSFREAIKVDVAEGTVTSIISLTKILEDVMRSTNGFEKIATDFWTAYLRRVKAIGQFDVADVNTIKKFVESGQFEETIEKNAFVPWFKIKTSVTTDYSQFDNINKMHRKIVRYKIIPHYIPVLKFVRPGMFAKAGSMRNAIKKQYNYIYTGDNVDVQNLRINYKTAFYQRNAIEVGKPGDNVLEVLDKVKSRLTGREDAEDKDVTGLRSYPSLIKGRNIVQKGAEDSGAEARKQEFFDYLTDPEVDMMRIELEILGDPAYICQDQFIPLTRQGKQISSKGRFSTKFKAFNVDNYSPLIELNYRLPDDIDEKREGLMFRRDSQVPEENLFFSGVYQVVRIESNFTNGQFTQTLTCVRLNNQNGLGEDVALDFVGNAQKKIEYAFDKTRLSKDNLKNSLRKARDDAIKQGYNRFKDILE
tara:strand:- start:52 stop:2409 length:2358 start_codon:yes stop_codon:yes gene_type:complete